MSEQERKPDTPTPNAETDASAKRARGQLYLKVSEKGAVSVYGLGRFPVTLYQEQWERLLAATDQVRQFIAQNEGSLKKKEA